MGPQPLGVALSRTLALCPQVPYLQRPIALWCGLNHSLVLSQDSDFNKQLLGCGCGAGGRLPGWPKGSASFVKLQVKVRAGAGKWDPREEQSSRAREPTGRSPARTRQAHFPGPLHFPFLPRAGTQAALSLSRYCWPCVTLHRPCVGPAAAHLLAPGCSESRNTLARLVSFPGAPAVLAHTPSLLQGPSVCLLPLLH